MKEHRFTFAVSLAFGLVLGWFVACGGESGSPTSLDTQAAQTSDRARLL